VNVEMMGGQNRLALVGQVASLSTGIADLSKLEGF